MSSKRKIKHEEVKNTIKHSSSKLPKSKKLASFKSVIDQNYNTPFTVSKK